MHSRSFTVFANCFEVLEISRQCIGHEKIPRFPRPYSACSSLQELREFDLSLVLSAVPVLRSRLRPSSVQTM